MPERKWVMTKVAPGDYLLPSNDGTVVWRLVRYVDGPSGGLDVPRDRDFWAVYRWTGELDEIDTSQEAWDRWACCTSGLPTRADAIADALSA